MDRRIVQIDHCDAHIVENIDDRNGNTSDDSNRNITLSNCFWLINETFKIEATSSISTNNSTNLDSKINDVNNSIFQLKDLINQTQKLLHNVNKKGKCSTEPKPTSFNLDVENCSKIKDDSQDHSWKKGTTIVVGHSVLSGFKEYKMSKRKTIKIRIFPNATIGGLKFFIIPQLRKSN